MKKVSKSALAAFLLMMLGVIAFRILVGVSPEEGEKITLVTCLGVASALLLLLSAWRDVFHIPSLAGFVLSPFTLMFLLAGRVSYLAFYFAGDVMGTGLSVWLIAALVLICVGMIAGILNLKESARQ